MTSNDKGPDPRQSLRAGDALLVVDVQNDFCPGGALPVPTGDEVVPVINRWLAAADAMHVPVFASRDWHPENHVSFEQRGGPWPRHCVENTPGAEFHPDLKLPPGTVVIGKGQDPDHDAYSPFQASDLADRLRTMGVKRVWVAGLAQDVCVKATAVDAARAGFETQVIKAATRPVDAGSGEEAIREMTGAGAHVAEGA